MHSQKIGVSEYSRHGDSVSFKTPR
jgi:hypothetical protein